MANRQNWRRLLMAAAAVAAVGASLAVYPLQWIPFIPYESNYGKGDLEGTGRITEGITVKQTFHAERTYLESIEIYMQNLQTVKHGSLHVSISEGEELLMAREIPLRTIENYEWHSVNLGVWLPHEGDYAVSFTTDVQQDVVLQLFAAKPGEGPAENGAYEYRGEAGKKSLAVNYRYLKPASSLGEAVPAIGIILLAGGLLIEAAACGKGRRADADEGE